MAFCLLPWTSRPRLICVEQDNVWEQWGQSPLRIGKAIAGNQYNTSPLDDGFRCALPILQRSRWRVGRGLKEVGYKFIIKHDDLSAL